MKRYKEIPSLVYSLPDSYAKPVKGRETETATNTWRLFELNEFQTKQIREESEKLKSTLNIYKCNGDALDRFGKMYGQVRYAGQADDEYRIAILTKINSLFEDGSINQMLEAVASLSGTEIGTLYFIETRPAMVALRVHSIEAFESLSNILPEIIKQLDKLLPLGVGLEPSVVVNGMFQFCTAGQEENIGFNGTGYNEQGACLGSCIE